MWYSKNNLQTQLQLLTIFAMILDVWEGSKYALVSDSEYTKALNMSELYRILNMSE